MTIDFKRYETFVDAVTSDASKDFVNLADRMVELDREGANIERLLTAGVGINAEGGEFLEIVKKMIFQETWNGANKHHLITELGDIMWYVANAHCMALDVSFDDVIATNVKKLERISWLTVLTYSIQRTDKKAISKYLKTTWPDLLKKY